MANKKKKKGDYVNMDVSPELLDDEIDAVTGKRKRVMKATHIGIVSLTNCYANRRFQLTVKSNSYAVCRTLSTLRF